MPMSESKKIYDFFKKYAQYKDLKDLYKKTVPAISSFEDKLSEYYTEQEKMKLIMSRFDEVLVNKANKEAIVILRDFVNDEFARKDANDTFVQRQTNQMNEVTENVSNLQELVKFQARQLQKDMYTAVRKGVQTALAAGEASQGGGGKKDGIDLKIVKEAMADKATVEQIEQLQVQKANKVDVEMCMRWVDMLHKMCNALATLHTLNFKTALEFKGTESAHM